MGLVVYCTFAEGLMQVLEFEARRERKVFDLRGSLFTSRI